MDPLRGAVRVGGRAQGMAGAGAGPGLFQGVPVEGLRRPVRGQRIRQFVQVRLPLRQMDLADQAVPVAVGVVGERAAVGGGPVRPGGDQRTGAVFQPRLLLGAGRHGPGIRQPRPEQEQPVRAGDLVAEPHQSQPQPGQRTEGRPVLAPVGLLELPDQLPGPVGEGLPGGIRQIVAVGIAAAQRRADPQQRGERGVEPRRVEGRGVGGPDRAGAGGEAGPGGEDRVVRTAVLAGDLVRAGAQRGVRGAGPLVAGAVAEVGIAVEPGRAVHRALPPGQLAEQLEGGRVALGGLRHVRGPGELAARLVAPGGEALGPDVGLGADGGAAAEVGDGAEGVRHPAPVPLPVGDRVQVAEAVHDQHPVVVDGVQQIAPGVLLPAQDHPGGIGAGGAQRLLDGAGGVRYGDVPGVAALVQQVHLEVVRRSQELLLVAVEGGGGRGEDVGARIEPVGALEAGPGALRHGARPGVAGGETVRDGAEVAGQDGTHAQRTQPVGDPAAQLRSLVDQLAAERAVVAAHVLQQPPRLVRRRREPAAGLGVGVAEVGQQPVVDGLGARGDQHLVHPVQRQHVDHPLPVRPVRVRGGVTVVGVVEGEAVRQRGGPLHRGGRGGQPVRQRRLVAGPRQMGPAGVFEVPVHAGQQHRGGGPGDRDPARPALHPEAVGAAVRGERHQLELIGVPGQQPGQRRLRRCGVIRPCGVVRRCPLPAPGGSPGGGGPAERRSGADRSGGSQQCAS